mgnify:CR=1 FL=1
MVWTLTAMLIALGVGLSLGLVCLGIFNKNVIYTGEKTNLFADKIEMNLTTKNTKIFMNDIGEKVLIEGTK